MKKYKYSYKAVQKAVQNWMEDGFAMVELKTSGGFGSIHTNVDDAIESSR